MGMVWVGGCTTRMKKVWMYSFALELVEGVLNFWDGILFCFTVVESVSCTFVASFLYHSIVLLTVVYMYARNHIVLLLLLYSRVSTVAAYITDMLFHSYNYSDSSH